MEEEGREEKRRGMEGGRKEGMEEGKNEGKEGTDQVTMLGLKAKTTEINLTDKCKSIKNSKTCYWVEKEQ